MRTKLVAALFFFFLGSACSPTPDTTVDRSFIRLARAELIAGFTAETLMANVKPNALGSSVAIVTLGAGASLKSIEAAPISDAQKTFKDIVRACLVRRTEHWNVYLSGTQADVDKSLSQTKPICDRAEAALEADMKRVGMSLDE